MFSSLCSGRRWQESLEDLRPSRAGAPPDPGNKPLIHAEGVNASRICVHRDPGPLQISGSTNVHRHEIERKRER